MLRVKNKGPNPLSERPLKRRMADTRLLRIATHDASPGSIDPDGFASFDIDLKNVMTQVHDCVGFSVESVGFYNLQPNVSPGFQRLLISVGGYLGGAAFIVVVPTSNYDSVSFPLALTNAILSQTGLAVNINAVVTPSGGKLALSMTLPALNEFTIWTEGQVADLYAPGFQGEVGDALATIMGFGVSGNTISYTSDTADLTSPFHVDLGGQRVAFLHSSYLIHDKSSIDGEGLTVSFFASLPINVPYEVFNLVYPNQYQNATTNWGKTHEIRNINLKLRTIRGDLLNVQGTEWFVTLRLFLDDRN